ncbi:DUF2461 family protein [Tuwongella immobilis]|uniref:AAA+ ATPase domain-containing protein n=1 Tax=Tuwongella immobilis TaxID=692036 RepID=A0A6C2YLX2_9BACT|nr:DUF2461 family protein [Tuwongella immobilis]VIP02085.1 gtpase subunit of restriction endonuclease-like protein : Predicted GTPase subunit of restriction endonuclease OS=Stigmatella aurantiaca (strain DW4/3-1) GN=STAUR_0505 PE=4 SV=1: DUF2461: AAA_5 [Tuwongella immobilis]VTS00341.1 gtpase subunit of restriction endonuclease-like protein : Predicted GTPase subunit of restriction endonuclease OS=Stigmatella aurantiaca (strain DW4/3-1) GN=STAUR_0505 PE=4 SV=1: DUF2461: AAA_5 [Tuwongella immobilis
MPLARIPLVQLLDLDRAAWPLPSTGSDPATVPSSQPVPQSTLRIACQRWLHPQFLDCAEDGQLADELVHFASQVIPPPVFASRIRAKVRFLRHGLQHWLHAAGSVPEKLAACLNWDGPYALAGFGSQFWLAIARAITLEAGADDLPMISASIDAGLGRLGLVFSRESLADWGDHFARRMAWYADLRQARPEWSVAQLDDFFARVGQMTHREIPAPPATSDSPAEDVADLVRNLRNQRPLRRFLAERTATLERAIDRLRQAIAQADADALRHALASVHPVAAQRLDLGDAGWPEMLQSILDAPTLADAWDEAIVDRLGWWLPAAVLHLRDPLQYPAWDEASRRGVALLADGVLLAETVGEGYELVQEAVQALAAEYHLHPLEVPDLLRLVANRSRPTIPRGESSSEMAAAPTFGGFCRDTFRFLAELEQSNHREWMQLHRERYEFAVREPLVELCEALTTRYIEPVWVRERGWDLETTAKSGRALSSIVRNDFGRGAPYQPTQWIVFYRRAIGAKRDDVQCVVRVDASGVAAGIQLGQGAREAGRRFRRQIQQHAEALWAALQARGWNRGIRFRPDTDAEPIAIRSAADLRHWATGRNLRAELTFAPDDPLLRQESLVNVLIVLFDQLMPIYACAVEEQPLPLLESWAGPIRTSYDATRFRDETGLGADWIRQARELLDMKRQLLLVGVPGTGKTHVARHLARLLTGDRPEAVRLVQFHAAYSYEEFVEGMKPRTIEVDGRTQVSYPIEPGVLPSFVEHAQAEPGQTFVLLIDEINRGNLARIFGELLYLLEYRDHAILLPYSRRQFQLPGNLLILGTMNGADRSTIALDQAMRRRFSVLEMPPDAGILADWLMRHPPKAEEPFASRVLQLFETLNARLRKEYGPECQIGHSFFMQPELDESKLRAIWEHHIRPLLDDYQQRHPTRRDWPFTDFWPTPAKSRR